MIEKSIPYGRQNITKDDIQAVVKTLRSNFLTQGPKIVEFEEAFAAYVGSKYAVAVSNGTAALHLSALVMGVKPGDKVITTPITFVASANCVRFCGGEVVFADINPETYLLDIKSVKRLLEKEPKGAYKGIIPVDFSGKAVNLEELKKLADEYGLWIIEDSCHAPGGYFLDSKGVQQKCGNGKYAELSIFSFHPVKHIACGEGGMVTTNDVGLYKKLIQLRSHGIIKFDNAYLNTTEFANGIPGKTEYPGWYMEMQELGYNYRLTDIQAALGTSQLKNAEKRLARRREIAFHYYNAFKDKGYIIRQSGFIEGHAYHLYVIEVNDRLNLYKHLKEHNIFPQIHYIPAHLMPYYRAQGYHEGDLPNSEEYYRHCISLPMYPTLTVNEQEYVIETIENYFK